MRAGARLLNASLVLAAALGASAIAAAPAARAATTITQRGIVGADRYVTAGQAATTGFGTAAAVVITSGTTFPDALSASYLAGAVGGPILLTDPTTLSAGTAAAIASLGAKRATIIGGTLAVGTGVAQQLTAMGLAVTRVAGPTRYDTSAAVATSQGAGHVGSVGGVPTAIVASGANFPDALATGPLAFADALPIVLTDPATLSPQSAGALSSLGVKQVVIAGGLLSVSAAVEAAIRALGITTVRVAGADRYETAAQIGAYAVGHLGFSYATPVLADGLTFADALAAGPLAGGSHSPILLTNGLPSATETALAASAATVTGLVGMGPAAADVPASALAAGATLTMVGTLTAQGTVLCGFPSSFAFNGAVSGATSDAPGHLAASLTSTGDVSPVDIDLTAQGTPISISYTDTGATFSAKATVVASAGTVTVTGTGSVAFAGCTAPYTLQATVT